MSSRHIRSPQINKSEDRLTSGTDTAVLREAAQKSLKSLPQLLSLTSARCLSEPDSSAFPHRQSVVVVGSGLGLPLSLRTGMRSEQSAIPVAPISQKLSRSPLAYFVWGYFVSSYKCTDFRHSFCCALSQIFNLFSLCLGVSSCVLCPASTKRARFA